MQDNPNFRTIQEEGLPEAQTEAARGMWAKIDAEGRLASEFEADVMHDLHHLPVAEVDETIDRGARQLVDGALAEQAADERAVLEAARRIVDDAARTLPERPPEQGPPSGSGA